MIRVRDQISNIEYIGVIIDKEVVPKFILNSPILASPTAEKDCQGPGVNGDNVYILNVMIDGNLCGFHSKYDPITPAIADYGEGDGFVINQNVLSTYNSIAKFNGESNNYNEGKGFSRGARWAILYPAGHPLE